VHFSKKENPIGVNKITKLLIANRGEIAVRIQLTAKEMGITTVAIHSTQDANSLFVEIADEHYLLEGDSLADTYLNIDKIISIAQQCGATAIHPGYGFLSENSAFAQACESNNIIFVGPSGASMELMGDKIASREFAAKAGLPLLKGIDGNNEELLAKADELDYPVIIKATAGGGGKGMRMVGTKEELKDALEATTREAISYFGNGAVFIEKYIEQPRHIEVQVLGDQHGNLIHLFERECTIQRRHQKIIEEAPSTTLSPEIRAEITKAAIDLAKAANYHSAGTVEFIVDENLKFYFMEMNTRIQVEHPVTELITDIDLIEQQIRIAQGEALSITQSDLTIDGHAIECRIYAEDPAEEFRPAPGTIHVYQEPETENTRIDTSLLEPQTISGDYDPMISKVSTWGLNREEAIASMQTALNDYSIWGIANNIDYLKGILADAQFVKNDISTNYCKTETARLLSAREEKQNKIADSHVVAAYLLHDLLTIEEQEDYSIWEELGKSEAIGLNHILVNDEKVGISNLKIIGRTISFNDHHAVLQEINSDHISFLVDNTPVKAKVNYASPAKALVTIEGSEFLCQRPDVLDENVDYEMAAEEASGNTISSPIPGTVVKLLTQEGKVVSKGDKLIIVEAMKMENTFTAPMDGVVQTITVAAGERVEAGKILIQLQAED